MIATEKAEIKQIVVEVLEEIADRSGPPDRLMLFLYQFIGDFKDFRSEMINFKTTTVERFDKIDEQFKNIDEQFKKVDERFKKVDERFDKVDERFDKVDKRFDKVEGRLDNIEKNMFTKTDWSTEKLRLIEGISEEFTRIIKENFNK
jgi:predicted nuclease with TOPRIM domain